MILRFKRNAVKLSKEPGRRVADVAENLGIYELSKGRVIHSILPFLFYYH